jgi:hypothetical protein
VTKRRLKSKRLKSKRPEPKLSPAEEVFESLVEVHGLTEPAHRALAWRASNALVSGGANNLSEAVRAIALLPSPRGMTAAERVTHVSGHTAKQRLWESVHNAIIVDRQELARRAARGEALTKVEALRLQLYRAEQAEAGHPDDERLGELEGNLCIAHKSEPKVSFEAASKPAIDPPTGDIVGPREQSDNPQNMRPPRYDAPRKPVTIDHEPVKAAAPTSAWNGPQDGPPPWLLTPAQNAARAAARPPPVPSSPSSSSPPPPAPTRTQSWDDTPGGQAWRMWADAGGYSGDGLCAAGWVDKLNGR